MFCSVRLVIERKPIQQPQDTNGGGGGGGARGESLGFRV